MKFSLAINEDFLIIFFQPIKGFLNEIFPGPTRAMHFDF